MCVNNDIYHNLGERWYTAFDDPVALLRQESKVKSPWVIERIQQHFSNKDLRVLDIGCGAGFLSNQLAKEGYHVCGIDLANDSLLIARKYDSTHSVEYQVADAYKLPFPDGAFDVVTAMDFLEHVTDPAKVIAEVSRVLKPKGLFFYHTFNRNWLAYIVIIKLVEWLVKNTPKNMHVLHLFLKPAEVRSFCERYGLHVRELTGIRPLFSTIDMRSLLKRTVPQNFTFTLTSSLKLSYMGMAEKLVRRS